MNISAKSYEWLVTIIFFFTWGFVFLDRLSVNYAASTLMEIFQLSTAQYSTISSVTALTSSLSAIFVGIISDRLGMRKRILAPMIMLAGLVSMSGSLCTTYEALLVVRGIAGLCFGATMTLIMAILSRVSAPTTLGRNSGIMNTGPAVLAIALGPVIVTQTVNLLSWKASFLLTGGCMLLISLLLFIFVKEVAVEKNTSTNEEAKKSSFKEMFQNKNIRLCCLIGICAMTGYWTILIFAPLYLTNVMHMIPTQMGFIASAMGIIYIPYSLFVPTLSDKFGRKKTLLVAYILCILSPVCMFVFAGCMISVIIYVIFGGVAGSLTPIYAGIIPMESLPDHLKASAGGIILGIAEITGGSLWPIAGGLIADATSISVVMGIGALAFMACVFLCSALTETNPRLVKEKAQQ